MHDAYRWSSASENSGKVESRFLSDWTRRVPCVFVAHVVLHLWSLKFYLYAFAFNSSIRAFDQLAQLLVTGPAFLQTVL